jgi:hypothetical protein
VVRGWKKTKDRQPKWVGGLLFLLIFFSVPQRVEIMCKVDGKYCALESMGYKIFSGLGLDKK